jgi:hypothetical protein
VEKSDVANICCSLVHLYLARCPISEFHDSLLNCFVVRVLISLISWFAVENYGKC